MKKLEIIYRKNERECNRALSLIDALKDENDTYRLIEPVLTEATAQMRNKGISKEEKECLEKE